LTPAGARLDRFLTSAIDEFKNNKDRVMPEAGGRRLASSFSGMMAEIRSEIDAATQKVADAVKELKAEISSGADGATKALQAEAAEVRKGFGELLGNNPPPDTSESS
jgi:hypothetical protein